MDKSENSVDLSNDWFTGMVDSINDMQQSFITNIKSDVSNNQSPNQVSLEGTSDLNELLDKVDDQTKEFIQRLTQGMDEIIKSHNIK